MSATDSPLPRELALTGGQFTISEAVEADLPEIIGMLSDDVLGSGREHQDLAAYQAAFELIDKDPMHLLVIVRDARAKAAATMQLTLLPGLSRGGSLRLQIESVRVASDTRGSGLGTALFNWAHEWGRAHGAVLAQLTTDKQREDAHRFYTDLGYTPSHEGFKLQL